jgi:hypothetical protein
MPSYQLTTTDESPRAWKGAKGGPMLSYKVGVKGDDGFEGVVEIAQKESTPAPTVGQTIEGTLDKSSPKYPPKLKKAFGGGGGGRPKPNDEEIRKAVAYKGAVELTCAAMATVPEKIKPEVPTDGITAMVEIFFYHGLALLEGKPVAKVDSPPPAGAKMPETGPSLDDLRAAYKTWAGDDPDALGVFSNKLTTLGLTDVAHADEAHRKELMEFLT